MYKAGFKMAKSTSAVLLQRRSTNETSFSNSTSNSKVLHSVAHTRPRTAPSAKARTETKARNMPPVELHDSHVVGRMRPEDIENVYDIRPGDIENEFDRDLN